MTIIIISLLLLVSLLPDLTLTAHVGIVNGNEVKPHSRPYMVSVQLDGHHVCGGALISDQFVLTAAHCWKQGEVLTVVVGAHDLRNSTTSDPYRVKSYIPHPKYKWETPKNDIMLFRLEKRVCLNANVGLISLPKDGQKVKVCCSVAGWGDLKTNGSGSDRLMEANTNILNDVVCKKKWGSIYKASKMICAYGYGGSCNGDSGGPLVCGNKPTAFGITSFSQRFRCNSPRHPNGYTKISAYLPWIRKKIRK